MLNIKDKTGYFRLAYRAALILFFLAFLPTIITHTIWMLRGEAISYMMRNRWDLVIINVVFFTLFLFVLPYRKKKNWRSKGIYSAFIIALFAEMYGFPLTTYLFLSRVGTAFAGQTPTTILSFNLFGTGFALPTMMVIGSVFTIIGILLVIVGWVQVYKNKGKLVKTGVYGIVRHPQYTGIIFIITGWILHWPTIPTLIMWPILIWTYYTLALKEEKELESAFGKDLAKYKANVPAFI